MPSISHWVSAARPKTLWAVVGPVLVGTGVAVGDGVFRSGPFLAALIGGLAIQVAANFANDVSDAERGADSDQRVGPTRVVAAGLLSPSAVWVGAWLAVVVAALCGIYLTLVAGWVIPVIGIASILALLGYTGGSRPYGYRGLGEVAVFVFFGPVATVTSRYVHDRSAPPEAWLLAIPVGLLAGAILVANNLRDIETDAVAGKRTAAVRLGRRRTIWLYGAMLATAFLLMGLFALTPWAPLTTALGLLAAPLCLPLIRQAATERGRGLIPTLEGTARLHLVASLLMAIGAAV